MLSIFRRALRIDRMALPPMGWRVPYVIVYGEPGRPLIHSVRSPEEVLFESHENVHGAFAKNRLSPPLDSTLRPNNTYYIMKVIIPVLSRCFALLGVDVSQWYTEMPKLGQMSIHRSIPGGIQPMRNMKGNNRKPPGQQGIIPHYFINKRCSGCELSVIKNPKEGPLCVTCLRNPQKTVLTISERIFKCDKVHRQLRDICFCCAKKTVLCQSLDCPMLYARLNAESNLCKLNPLTNILRDMF